MPFMPASQRGLRQTNPGQILPDDIDGTGSPPPYLVQPGDTQVGGVPGTPDFMPRVGGGPATSLPQRRGGGAPQPQGRYDPNMLSTEDKPGADELSPTTIVLQYLKSKGLPLTAENIRRTVDANARDPNVLGPNLAGYVTPAGRDIELRNAGTEDTSAPPSARGGGGRPLPVPPIPPGASPASPGGTPQVLPMPDAGVPPGGQPPPSMQFPPPIMPAPVGGTPAPQMPPPPVGAANTPPTSPDPIRDAITRAISGPPSTPALPPPPVRPQIAAPPEVPALPAPPPQLALPAPDVPNVVGQSGRPPLALPAPAPNISTSTTLRGQPAPVRVAPGNRIQGAPIQPGPVAGPLGRAVVGGIAGASRGIPGAIAGAAPGAIDLGRYIAKGLHLY